MAYDAQEQRIMRRAERALAKDVEGKRAQAERMGWDTPLESKPLSFHVAMARAFEKELAIAEKSKAKQERYRAVHGHYPRYSVMGQGR